MDTCLQLLVNGAILLIIQGFSCSSTGKETACNEGDPGSIPGLGRCPGDPVFWPGEFHGLYSPCVVNSQTWLSLSYTQYFTLNCKLFL